MNTSAKHDSWTGAEAYEAYMGRWSRKVAPLFLDWLSPPKAADWLDTGCGTGASSAAIGAKADPASVLGIEPSEAFVARASQNNAAPLRFRVGKAPDLPTGPVSGGTGFDMVVAGLVLNFLPDTAAGLDAMRRVTRAGGRVRYTSGTIPGAGWR